MAHGRRSSVIDHWPFHILVLPSKLALISLNALPYLEFQRPLRVCDKEAGS